VLIRQKIILSLLSQSNRGYKLIPFVKLMFLLGEETELRKHISYYDFVPYRFGPFSFTLYQEVNNLRKYGYIAEVESEIRTNTDLLHLVTDAVRTLPKHIKMAVSEIARRYGKLDQNTLLRDVYDRYKWFTIHSELSEFKTTDIILREAPVAIYTAGYEQQSIESFLNSFLKRGIKKIIDTRANPVSRRFGFAKSRLIEITMKLGLEYCHVPELGIKSTYRKNLTTPESYRQLLDLYESEMLSGKVSNISQVGKMMLNMPSVLICMEGDERRCHRSRLAAAIAAETNLSVIHL